MNRTSIPGSPFTKGLALTVAATFIISSQFTQAQTTTPTVTTPPNNKPATKPTNLNGPYRAFGRVTDQNGQPFPGAEIVAHCGMGTLKRSATAISDKDGRYELEFGRYWNKTIAAAVISAHKPGYVEANLNRHGSCLSAPNEHEWEQSTFWKDRKDRRFLPDHPLEFNFVLLPAARVSGQLIDDHNKPLPGYWVSLVGPELPAASSAMDTCKTDEHGHFTLEDISTTRQFQFSVRNGDTKPPWNDAWASAALQFDKPEIGDLQAHFGTQEIRIHQLHLRLTGPGVHQNTATTTAAAQGTLNITTPNPSDIQQQTKTRLVARKAVLTLQNQLSPSLITESVPMEPAREVKEPPK